LRPSSELSDSGIEEETTPQRNPVPPEAFKFYMEQHIENVLKAYQQRQQRRMKLEMEMSKRGLDEATCEQMRKLLAQKESNFLRMKRAKLHRDQFDIVKPIGVGAFGVVSLVRKKDTRKLYAMKSLRKADVVRRNQVAHVKAERDILAEADNEWVVKLYYSFQDSECLYFVMDYIPGGDMMSLLIKLGTFPEHLTLFYIAELVCAIESVHKMGFIHRDIKPDNILIEADGHIKLTDFGLCTGFRWTHDSNRYQPKGAASSNGHNRQSSIEPDTSAWGNDQCNCPMKPLELRRLKEHHRCVAHSLVGTPNYIAPEILRRIGYTQLCDWWSVGVIMYEMLVGQPPFMAPTPAETQLKIMNWPEYLRIPHHAQLSPASRDLIIRFLSDPQERLGRNGADEIKRHPFFTSRIEWDVGIRNYVAPYKPKIMSESDTSNFDPIPMTQLQKIHKQHQTPSLPKDHTHQHAAFYEFTFIRFATSDKGNDSKRPTIAPTGARPSSNSSSPVTSHDRSNPATPTSTSGSNATSAGPSPLPPVPGGNSPSTREHSRKDKKRNNPQPVYV
jgi:serine/threonine-protein kinase LATS1/2